METKRLLEDAEPFVKHKLHQEQYKSLNLNKRPDSALEDETAAAAATAATTAATVIMAETSAAITYGLTVASTAATPVPPPPPPPPKSALTKLLETLELSINQLYITFCEESGFNLQPLAIVKLELNGRVSNWTRNLHLKATLSLEASYYNDHISSWEPLVENCMEREDVYRPWLLSVWFAMEPGGILQPPIDQKGIRSIEFPIQDLDYSPLDEQQQKSSGHQSPPALEHVPSESMFGESTKLSSKANRKLLKQQLKQQQKKTKISSSSSRNNAAASGAATPRPPESRAEVCATPGATTTREAESTNNNAPIASYVQIESNDYLNLNVTPSAYRVIMYLAQITAGASNKEFLESKVKPALKFLNFLGENCELTVSPGCQLEPENAVGFTLNYENDQLRDGGNSFFFYF